MKILLLYIKHALHMMREEKLFSGIYIAGTALAIAFTMVMAIVYYVKLAKIYPEVNRDKMVYIDDLCFMNKEGRVHMTCHFSDYAFEKWFAHAKNVEYVAPICSPKNFLPVGSNKRDIIGKNGKLIEVESQVTNHDFFNIFKFEFLKGRPITREDVEQHNPVAVITNDLAEQLFGKDVDPVGKMIGEEGDEYRICGVVKGASPLTPVSYAQVYVNYSYYYQNMVYDNENLSGNYIGGFSVIATVKDNAQYQALKQELDATAARWSQIMEGEPISLTHTMSNHAQHVLEIENELGPFHRLGSCQTLRGAVFHSPIRPSHQSVRYGGRQDGETVVRNGRAESLWCQTQHSPVASGVGKHGADSDWRHRRTCPLMGGSIRDARHNPDHVL